MAQTLEELMAELRNNPNLKLLVSDFDEHILHSSGYQQAVYGSGQFVQKDIGTDLKKIMAVPNVRVIVVSKGTNQKLANDQFANNPDYPKDLLVVTTEELYEYLDGQGIQQAPVVRTIHKPDLIQSIRLGILGEIKDLAENTESKRVLGYGDDSEHLILDCIETKYNFPVILAPHEGSEMCQSIAYFSIWAFLAKYNDYKQLVDPVKEQLLQALITYKQAFRELEDFTLNDPNYDINVYKQMRMAMHDQYKNALTHILALTKQIELDIPNNFQKALKQVSDFQTNNKPLQRSIQKLTKQVGQLQKKNQEPTVELTQILQDTHSVLTGNMDINAYTAKAKALEKKPSKGMKIVGGLMIVVGLAAVAAGVAMAFTGLGIAPGAVVAGAGLAGIATGAGFFAKGNKTKTALSAGMQKVATETEKASFRPKLT